MAAWQAQKIEELAAQLEEANITNLDLQRELASAQRFQSEQYSKLTLKMEYLERVHDPVTFSVSLLLLDASCSILILLCSDVNISTFRTVLTCNFNCACKYVILERIHCTGPESTQGRVMCLAGLGAGEGAGQRGP